MAPMRPERGRSTVGWFRMGNAEDYRGFAAECERSTVFINEMRAVHRLTNRAKIPYLSGLIELKSVRWTTEVKD